MQELAGLGLQMIFAAVFLHWSRVGGLGLFVRLLSLGEDGVGWA